MITIGIDPHKASITAVALDERTTQLGELRLPLGQTRSGSSWRSRPAGLLDAGRSRERSAATVMAWRSG